MTRVAILGAGLTGLLVGRQLKKLGIDFTIYEANDRVGGMIGSFREDGFLAEHGPHTFLERGTIAQVVEELGLADQRVYANESANKRFAVRDGRIQALPSSPPTFFKTPLYSSRAKLRLFLEPWVKPRRDDVDESVTNFVRRRLGDEFLDYGLDLLVNGIWSGDPNRLSARHAFKRMYGLERDHGSLIRGAIAKARQGGGGGMPRLFAFRNGNDTLPLAVAAELGDAVKTSHRVTHLVADDHGWTVKWKKGRRTSTRTHEIVLSTMPIHALEKIEIVHPDAPPISHPVFDSPVRYPPVGVVTLGLKRSQVEHPMDGFGLLIPEIEHRKVLGAMFTSTLFPNRTPSDDYCTIGVFVGGDRHGSRITEWTDDQRLDAALTELGDLMGVRGTPTWVHQATWQTGIPQYEVGYGKALVGMQAFEKTYPGIELAGNFRNGVAVPDLVDASPAIARKLAASLESNARRHHG